MTAKTASIRQQRTPRPVGVKAVKAAAQATSSAEITQKRLADAAAKLAQASQKRARALEKVNNFTLFMVRLDELDAEAQKYFQLCRNAILAPMRRGGDANDSANLPEAMAKNENTDSLNISGTASTDNQEHPRAVQENRIQE
ncbi:hypothetical protein GN244_ATG14227 [Phytophthora infestans]|uniref:No apical meristem-associated C-terminal domain-containing protein n=1 Tax=Phytophthora infestans TaxID=4787 RepID=A0A833WGN7_PHYIN|nr:hypothetical protein GN244_ATG14227 [Phytophthora infestans]KAF4148362.1 hypothetical protein GN958_ATG02451 [Phytophthora infestans]